MIGELLLDILEGLIIVFLDGGGGGDLIIASITWDAQGEFDFAGT